MKRRTTPRPAWQNLVAKHSTNKGGAHKDKKRASKRVRGSKHKEDDDGLLY